MLSPLLDPNDVYDKIVTFKAANVGIVRVIFYAKGKVDYLFDLKSYHLAIKTSANFIDTPVKTVERKKSTPIIQVAYNIRGQKISKHEVSRSPFCLYLNNSKSASTAIVLN